jgi:predicted metal-dependent phosphoesterase TrpH
MRRELHYFDIFPKTVKSGEHTVITIRALGSHAGFVAGRSYRITFVPMYEPILDPERSQYPSIVVNAGTDFLSFEHRFIGEQEFAVRVTMDEAGHYISLSIYCLEADLFAMLPLKGDLHVHTTYSDGAERPEIVAANYRKAGYDFLVISDHWNDKGSLAAQKFYSGIPIDITIIQGEEVHAPGNPVHIVNFGGEHSINALLAEDETTYHRDVEAMAAGLPIPDDGEALPMEVCASCLWVGEAIRKAKGLAILAHPFWIVDTYQLAPSMTRYLLQQEIFDALELVGGLTPRENMMQLAFYHTELAMGRTEIPVVGSSDSHGTVIEPFAGSRFANPVDSEHGYFEFFTIVFAPSNDKDAIIAAIRGGRCVAVDHYRGETPRVYGDFRMVAYALFLMSEYFPLHEDICVEEGRVMREYATVGDHESLSDLRRLHGRVGRLWTRYFGIKPRENAPSKE